MTLNELPGKYTRKNIICYASDCTTAIEKKKDLQLISGAIYRGKTKRSEYGQESCKIFVYYEKLGVGLEVTSIVHPAYTEADEVLKKLPPCYTENPMDLIAKLDTAVTEEVFISNAEIRFAKYAAPENADKYADTRTAVIIRRNIESEARSAEGAAELAARRTKIQAKADAAIDAALSAIRKDGTVENSEIYSYHASENGGTYKVINIIARRYGVEIPLKVQGWINKSLCSCNISDGRLSSCKIHGRYAKTFSGYMEKIIEAVRKSDEEMEDKT